ncbi:transposase [Paenibacillus sp. FSL R7-277]|uniref:transposase n=1 Tax=unclassified Paenibacillus TaxID=185978 RepID=UPI0012DC2C61
MVTRAERKRYNKQVKEEAVKNIQEQRKSMDEIALELNIPKWPLENWICGA